VSDHGHNGVALTITKCDAWPKTKLAEKEARKTSEVTCRTNLSSNHPLHSTAISEVDEEYEETRHLGEDFHSPQLDSSSAGGKQFIESVTTGITTDGNKMLEWFTVLAEYQHRKQLNRIHNSISCIVCDYDAVIPDISRPSYASNIEGMTTFGIYHFEGGLRDGSAAKVSNMKVIASLEELHWMEHQLVEQIGRLSSTSKQQRALNKIRQTWDHSSNLKASKSIGGPNWLIKARVKAMWVPLLEEHYDKHCSENSNLRRAFIGFEPNDFSCTSSKKVSEGIADHIQGADDCSNSQIRYGNDECTTSSFQNADVSHHKTNSNSEKQSCVKGKLSTVSSI
jgi:hypothetical protein